jgi:glycosyltransferase involved in cell wall biosynthesis
LNKRVIDSARGIIVHSRFVESLLRAEHSDSFVRQVNHHVIPEGIIEEISAAERMALRRKHGIPLEARVIGSFGFINAEKRLEQVLQALSLFKDLFPLFGLFVGEALIDTRRLQETIKRLGLTDRVKWTGFVDLITFRELAALADICISLRFPTMGETSGSLCRLLAAGKPCIVSYAGWFAELPDSCVVKVGVHTHEVEELANAIWELIIDEPRRLQLGRDARAYVQRHHRIEDTARIYLEFCQEIHEREKGWIEQSLASECAEVLNDIGVREMESDLSRGLSLPGRV